MAQPSKEPASGSGALTAPPLEATDLLALQEALVEATPVTLRRGAVIEGTVVRVDRDGILVDIGLKYEGIIAGHEAQQLIAEGRVRVGDQVLVYVVQPENAEGQAVLSLKRARAEHGWRLLQRLAEEGQTLEAEVVDYNKGGLIVDAAGVRGFVPLSQVASIRHDGQSEEEIRAQLAALVGRTLRLKVLEVNRKRNRVILSERVARQEERAQRKEELLATLQPGEVRTGRVTSLCSFGAFVDIGGADGLVHLSELSWVPVNHPSEVVQVGDTVTVVVLAVDREKKKIALSLRRAQPEPWTRVAEKYRPGDLVTAVITRLTTFGAFARIPDGVEGLIHISELSTAHVTHPSKVVKEGDVVTARILRIEPERRRLGLSLRDVPRTGE